MFLNRTSNLWDFWADGEYYDSNTNLCRSWDRSWSGLWGYQSFCFDCPPGNVLDADTLEWTSQWDPPKTIIRNSQFSISAIWRGNQFYVDSSSSSILELGTRSYPYKSIKSVFVELLNHHSNQDKSVTIFLKEKQNYYIEDGMNYILNITSVTITSYSDELGNSGRARLVPTHVAQPAQSKTIFNLLTNTSLMLDSAINQGNYTDAEVLTLGGQVTLFSVRSSVQVDNLDIERETDNTGRVVTLFSLVYLQDKTMRITNVYINVTGIVMAGNDPFNGFFENITLDTYRLRGWFSFIISWNYPEAVVKNEIIFNYIKVVTTNDRPHSFTPTIVSYQGPSNITVKNSDFIDFYASTSDSSGTLLYYKDNNCQPNDDLVQTFTLDNITTSILENSNSRDRFSILAALLNFNLYRSFKTYAMNLHNLNFDNPVFGVLYLQGEQTSELHMTNWEIRNLTSGRSAPVWVLTQGSVYFENIVFENVSDTDVPLFYFDKNFNNVTVKNVTVGNVTGTSISLGDIFVYRNLN